jgi:hypothetical protein
MLLGRQVRLALGDDVVDKLARTAMRKSSCLYERVLRRLAANDPPVSVPRADLSSEYLGTII